MPQLHLQIATAKLYITKQYRIYRLISTIRKLNTQPMPGVYILHLESKGFSESIKVVVE